MKIIVIGATGTIGKAVADALASKHEVVRASRKGNVRVDIEDETSICALFVTVPDADAVVCCAGNARFKPLAELEADDYLYSFRSKLLGQINVARHSARNLREGGSITLTSGVLASQPSKGSGAVSPTNAGVEAFVRAAALDLPKKLRINVVSPPWVSETLSAMKQDPSHGKPAAEVARAYVAAVEGQQQGQVLVV